MDRRHRTPSDTAIACEDAPEPAGQPTAPSPRDLAVVGLGYVGLALAREATRAGLSVAGLDRDAGIVAQLAYGRSHIDDVSHGDVADMLATGFVATTDPEILREAQTIVICVPTPLTLAGAPDLTAVRDAAGAVSDRLRPGTLVILESTTYPGTTEEELRPILERSGLVAGRDFHLAFSPERIDPGNPVFGVGNTPKIVGGLTPSSSAAAEAFYGKFVASVVTAKGTREAEMAKLLENTYRQVNIALVNELSMLCHELGIDLWDAITCASTKPFGFQAFYPGPGVGGHCIPIDPSYLSYKVRTVGHSFRFVELAREINSGMPRYVAARAQQFLNARGLPIHGAEVLLLGVTYKADIADQRESPARPAAERLLGLGANVSFHDPYVSTWTVGGRELVRVGDLIAAVEAADLTILLTDHRDYTDELLQSRVRRLLDTRGRTARAPRVDAEAL